MATRDEIRDHVVRPLTANFGAHQHDDPEAYRDLLERALMPHPVPALQRAVEKIVMTRKYRDWPTIADIVKAVRDTGQAGKEDGKVKYPLPARGVNADNFWMKSQEFVERDFESRGTCLTYLRRGTAQWESWAIYFDKIGLNLSLLNRDGWSAPTEWPWQFDSENGQSCTVPMDFEEYVIEPEYQHDSPMTAEQKAKAVENWKVLRENLLKRSADNVVI